MINAVFKLNKHYCKCFLFHIRLWEQQCYEDSFPFWYTPTGHIDVGILKNTTIYEGKDHQYTIYRPHKLRLAKKKTIKKKTKERKKAKKMLKLSVSDGSLISIKG